MHDACCVPEESDKRHVCCLNHNELRGGSTETAQLLISKRKVARPYSLGWLWTWQSGAALVAQTHAPLPLLHDDVAPAAAPGGLHTSLSKGHSAPPALDDDERDGVEDDDEDDDDDACAKCAELCAALNLGPVRPAVGRIAAVGGFDERHALLDAVDVRVLHGPTLCVKMFMHACVCVFKLLRNGMFHLFIVVVVVVVVVHPKNLTLKFGLNRVSNS